MTRFVILTQFYPPEVGAAQIRLAAFASALQQRGHEVQVVTAMPNYPSGRVQDGYRRRLRVREEVDGIPVERAWIYPATGSGKLKRVASYCSFAASSVPALMRIRSADVLFVESPPLFLGGTALLASALRRQRLCVNISDLWPDSVVAIGLMGEDSVLIRVARRLERVLYRRAWKISVVTDEMRETLITDHGIPREKVQFLPNGVDVKFFAPQLRDEALLQQLGLVGKAVFAYTGLHGYAQGLDVILGAAEFLRDRLDIALLFVGDGPEKARVVHEAAIRGLDNVFFLDLQPVSAMPRIFSIVTASIVPLLDRPLFSGARPSKIFPALACATPVVFCGKGETARIIEGARCGVVVPPEDPRALAEAIVALADDPARVATLGATGRAFVEEHYSWTTIVDRWLEDITL